VDAILAGEGDGPLSPDPVDFGYVICGTNPIAIDSVCAYMMGFNPHLIPSIEKAFKISSLPLCSFSYNDIRVFYQDNNYPIFNLPTELSKPFASQFGWVDHIERNI
jgi:uncharacterized protein (DUF362 family)